MWKQTAILLVGAFVCSVVCAPEPLQAEAKTEDVNQFDAQMNECIDKDSISCAQIQMYRKVRSFFNAESIDLFAGLTLVKSQSAEKSGRALEQLEENEILNSADADKRESALEDFTFNKATNFFQERSLQWNLKPVVTEVVSAARGMIDSVPADVQSKVNEFVEEGRGKKKKLMKHLIPFIAGLKLKLGLFAVISYFVIALIAKKAILASLISLAISAFIAVKKLSAHHPPAHHEVVEHHAHSAGWAAPAASYSSGGWDSYGGGHDAHGAYSNQVAHSVAYNGQKPVRR